MKLWDEKKGRRIWINSITSRWQKIGTVSDFESSYTMLNYQDSKGPCRLYGPVEIVKLVIFTGTYIFFR